MRLGEPVEWALHCTTVLALLPSDAAVPAARLAEFHGVPAAYLAKTLQALARQGVVESVPGRRGGYRLAKPPADIPALDVVEAIEGRQSSFRCTEIRKRGPTKVSDRLYSPVCTIAAAMHRADAAWRAELASTSIGDLVIELANHVPVEAAVKGVNWLQEVQR